MSDGEIRRCPDHAHPEADALRAWPCPDTCEHFADELKRRIDDVRINGNYVSTWKDEESGVRYKQRYRNHQPVEEPVPWNYEW